MQHFAKLAIIHKYIFRCLHLAIEIFSNRLQPVYMHKCWCIRIVALEQRWAELSRFEWAEIGISYWWRLQRQPAVKGYFWLLYRQQTVWTGWRLRGVQKHQHQILLYFHCIYAVAHTFAIWNCCCFFWVRNKTSFVAIWSLADARRLCSCRSCC